MGPCPLERSLEDFLHHRLQDRDMVALTAAAHKVVGRDQLSTVTPIGHSLSFRLLANKCIIRRRARINNHRQINFGKPPIRIKAPQGQQPREGWCLNGTTMTAP